MDEIVNRVARMCFDEDERMLYVTILPDAVMDLANVKQHFDMMSEITRDEGHYALIDSANPYSITEEALEYVVRPDVLRGRKAAAYYQLNLANRFPVMQVQIKMRAAIPTYSFKQRDEAVLWLRSLNLVKRNSL